MSCIFENLANVDCFCVLICHRLLLQYKGGLRAGDGCHQRRDSNAFLVGCAMM